MKGEPSRAPRGRSAARSRELPVISHYYELFVWSYERAEGFPKVLRSSLTLRFQQLLLDGLEGLLELRYTREREPHFRRVNMTFEKLRFVSRALKDRRALSPTQYEHFHRLLGRVGRQLGGWQKTHGRRGEAEAVRVTAS